jgi:hypothetical protein
MAGRGDVGARLRASGWRQGSVVPAAACDQFDLDRPAEAKLAVVVSQDCDVVAGETVESNVELVAAIDTNAPDLGTLYGKHPRRLSLPLLNSARYIELGIRHRTFVPKAKLCEFNPDMTAQLSIADVRTMARWLGKRYTRDAFPDTFNRRLSSARDKLDKLSKSEHGKSVSTVLVSIEKGDVELKDDEPYRIALWFVYRGSQMHGDWRRAQAERFAGEFAAAVNSCGGIEVADDWDVRTLGQVTLEDLETLKRFDFDYRTVAPHPDGDGP